MNKDLKEQLERYHYEISANPVLTGKDDLLVSVLFTNMCKRDGVDPEELLNEINGNLA